ncbi:MAG: T9SS C-terminal target domain-containing protein [Leadbetterella sp.]|nr:T9SS C-terminal target domain-containing protein [Leadbetterella sp.]
MVTNLKRKWIVFGFVLLFVSIYRVSGQNCTGAQDFSFSPSQGGINWRQFPEFSLPFTIIYSGSQAIYDPDALLKRGFTHVSNPNGISSLPTTNRAYIYYGVANADQPWRNYKSPYGNDMNVYHRKWDDDLVWFRTQNGGSSAVDIFCLDIETHHKSRDSVLALKTRSFVPAEIRALSDEAFIARYQKDMQDLYAYAAAYIKQRVNARVITAYGDVPIANTFTNIQGPSWEKWQTDPGLLNYIAYDFQQKKAGGSYYALMDVLSPNAYFYYDYPHIFAGEYLSYLMFQTEANRAWSARDQWIFLWNRYSYTPQFTGKNIRPWMSEAMAIFPFFSGARGIWLWDNMEPSADYSGYGYFMKGLYRLSAFRSFFEGDHQLVQPVSARDYNENKQPVWRGVYKDGRLLVAAHNPWAKSENEQVTITINYGSLKETITLKGYEVFLCSYAADAVAGNEPALTSLTVYPNPAEGPVSYKVKTGGERFLRLSVSDELGRVLHREEVDTQGAAEYTASLDVRKYKMHQLYLRVEGGSFSHTRKILIQP